MKASDAIFKALVGAYAFFWIGGIGAYAIFGQPPEHVAWTAPVFLFIAGIVSLWVTHRRDRLPLALAGVLGFAFEVLGVYTGYPFGGYEYTDALAPRLFTVPLAMIPAWIVLLAYIRAMLATYTVNRWAVAALGALWMTAIDLVLDPVAAGPMGLWIWDHAGAFYGIPITNFAGWYVTSFIILVLLPKTSPNRSVERVGVSIVAFFAIMAWLHQLVIAGCIGIGLLGLHAALARLATSDESTDSLQGETRRA